MTPADSAQLQLWQEWSWFDPCECAIGNAAMPVAPDSSGTGDFGSSGTEQSFSGIPTNTYDPSPEIPWMPQCDTLQDHTLLESPTQSFLQPYQVQDNLNHQDDPTIDSLPPTHQTISTDRTGTRERRRSNHSKRSSDNRIRTTPTADVCQRKRERNRVAAAKCRQKSKVNVDDLRHRERRLSQNNDILKAQAGCLREEVLGLKNSILQHCDCDSQIIDQHIANEATRVQPK